MGRYRKQKPLGDINVEFAKDEIMKFMKRSGYLWREYNKQKMWRKEVKNPWRPFAPPMRIYFVFSFNKSVIEYEAFVVWMLLFFYDSGEYGLEGGIFGVRQQDALSKEIDYVNNFLDDLIRSEDK